MDLSARKVDNRLSALCFMLPQTSALSFVHPQTSLQLILPALLQDKVVAHNVSLENHYYTVSKYRHVRWEGKDMTVPPSFNVEGKAYLDIKILEN